MNKQLLYGIIAATLLIALGFFGYTWYQSTKSPELTTNTQSVPDVQVQQQAVVYRNNTYGFSVPLPSSWEGYSVVEKPEGTYLKISIQHPQSTKENPRMDVPVLVVPIAIWNTWYPSNAPLDGQHPFAAPVPATERARNAKYVFATAPRYNFSYLPGWEEVEEIVKGIRGLPTLMQIENTPSEIAPLFKEGEIKG